MPEFVNPFSGSVPKKLSLRELCRALRLSLASEEEATHLYESLADATDNELAKAVLQDIANEERVHKGEFQKLIELLLPDEAGFMAQGAEEVEEIHHGAHSETASAQKPFAAVPTVGDLRSSECSCECCRRRSL
ncbi:MAG: Rubrerythrin [Chitinispirillia bacterium]|nr:Rubrerythrin [Chitinispirillia bacterium]